MKTAKEASLQTVSRELFVHNETNRLLKRIELNLDQACSQGFRHCDVGLFIKDDVAENIVSELSSLGYKSEYSKKNLSLRVSW